MIITRPDDYHVHFRDGFWLENVVIDTARQFNRAIVMPNLQPPITNTGQALEYYSRILDALHQKSDKWKNFHPLMTLYLTNNTSAKEILRARDSGHIHGVKLYPWGVTTHSESGVTDLLVNCKYALQAMEKYSMPLLIHGEVGDKDVDIFDREAIFIDKVLVPLRRSYPGLKIVLEHITSKEAVDYICHAEGTNGATITPQHLLYNRNTLLSGGLKPHFYCLPILKGESHRKALISAATSGNPKFFLGTDSAPHPRYLKEHSYGCAGCYTALHAMSLYATAFESVGALDKLEGFASFYGADFYGLPRSQDELILVRQNFNIPSQLYYGGETLVPLAAGKTLNWSVKL